MQTLRRVAVAAAKTAAFPLALAVIVAVFLAIQDRIDRKDPKLALAPLRSPMLSFEPRMSERAQIDPPPWGGGLAHRTPVVSIHQQGAQPPSARHILGRVRTVLVLLAGPDGSSGEPRRAP